MNKTLGGLVVGIGLIAGTAPALAVHQDMLGRRVPDRTTEEWNAMSGGRSRDTGSSTDVRDSASLTQETISQMGQKLGRGLVNASTGWIELPKEMYRISRQSNPAFGLVLGSFSGVELSVVRTLAGVYEAATFPVPIPREYVPLVLPTSVFTWEDLYLREVT